jgi:hypothetical protein
MSTRLDEAVARARDDEGIAWDAQRADRVLAGALQKRETRARRARIARAVGVGCGAAALLVVALLRTAQTAPARETVTVTTNEPAQAIATRDQNDGGSVRD